MENSLNLLDTKNAVALLDELKHKLALAKEHHNETSEKHMNCHPDVGWSELLEASAEVAKWDKSVDAVETMMKMQLFLAEFLG